MNQFDIIRNDGRLIFEFIRGSQLYNLNTPTSDMDTSGVFLCTYDQFAGLFGYQGQVSDARHDNTWFEIGELLRLLMKSNPTVLEILFVPEDKILVPPHPLMQLVIENRDKFVTKECFNPFFGYAKSQIEKARGLNKKIVNPIEKRLDAIDFVYTFRNQGSERFVDWLDARGLRAQFCGLVNVPNMRDIFGAYYDFGAHCAQEKDWPSNQPFICFAREYFSLDSDRDAISLLSTIAPANYRGVFDQGKDSSEVRLSSIVDKNDRPICFISYNRDAYSHHCRAYADYQRWEKERNPQRYLSNLQKTYDAKNMMHMFRLVHMASEIAEGRGVILKRTEDRQFLMDVRAHKYEFNELMDILERETARMNQLMAHSSIPDHIDRDFVNALMIEIRTRQF